MFDCDAGCAGVSLISIASYNECLGEVCWVFKCPPFKKDCNATRDKYALCKTVVPVCIKAN